MYGNKQEKPASNWLNIEVISKANPEINQKIQELMALIKEDSTFRFKRGLELSGKDNIHEVIVDSEKAARAKGETVPVLMIGKVYLADVDAKPKPVGLLL